MKDKTMDSYHERILKVLVHVQNNLSEALELSHLASMAMMSESHFHRVFKGMMGETMMEHVRRIRLERAAYHLSYTRDSVTEVAFDAGYETLEAFSRSFRTMFGASPTEFRSGGLPAKPPQALSGVHYLEQNQRSQLELIPQKELNMEVAIKQFDPLNVAFVRHTGPYAECAEAWKILCDWAGSKGLIGPNTQFLGVSHDDPQVTDPHKIRYDACLTLENAVEPEGRIGVMQIEGGDYAVALHKGPFENLEQSYGELFGVWLPQSGREVRNAPCYEVYLNDPDVTAPEDLLVELRAPLRPVPLAGANPPIA